MDKNILFLILVFILGLLIVIPSTYYVVTNNFIEGSDNNDDPSTFHTIIFHLSFTPHGQGTFHVFFPLLLYQDEPDMELIKEIEKQHTDAGLVRSSRGFGLGVETDDTILIDVMVNMDRDVWDYSLSMQNPNGTYNFFSLVGGFMEYKIDIFDGNSNMTFNFMDNLYDDWLFIEQS